MAEEILEQLDPEIIERLMMTDPAFMAKMSDVKTRIYNGLSLYADSLKASETGMFTSSEVDEITSAKNTVMKSWDALQARLNVDISKSIDNTDQASGNEGVFKAETPSFILESLGDTAITQIKKLMGDGGNDTAIDRLNSALKIGSSGGMIKNLLGSIGNGLLLGLGMKAIPTWITSAARAAGAAAPIVMLAGGLIWAAIDGVRGFFKADEWGTSKTSGIFGGLLGGMDHGIRGALKNFGKFAMIGVGIGMAGGPIGMILGGLIGGIVGAVLGWIGGEKIAKAFDRMGKWFYDQFEIITDYLGGAMSGAWDWFKLAGTAIKDWFNMITDYLANIIEKIPAWFDNLTTGVAEVLGDIGDWFGTIKDKVFNAFERIKGWFGDKLKMLDPRNWGKDDNETESDLKTLVKRSNSGTDEILKRRSNDPPEIVIGEMVQSDKKTQEALDANNIFAEQMVEALKVMNQNQARGVEAHAELLKQIAEKPISDGGSGQISLDFGEMRESTLDASYNFRSQYHGRRM